MDAELWRTNTSAVADQVARALHAQAKDALVPVAKGNGYGLSNHRLARESERLGVDAMSVGTIYEVEAVANQFTGNILVLQPWDPRDQQAYSHWHDLTARLGNRLIRTIASTDSLHQLAALEGNGIPFVLEGLTSMRRFGFPEADLDALLADETVRDALRSGKIAIVGIALHLPLAQPATPQIATVGDARSGGPSSSASNRVREAWGWAAIWIRALAAMESAEVPLAESAATLWVSHLSDTELVDLRQALPKVPIRARIGTRLWLGAADALHAYGTVLAVQQVDRGREVGYRQRRVPKTGYVVVVGGGTAHGVGMEAPSQAANMRQRAIAATTGALEAVGKAKSPFAWAGKQRWFVEPPHMQVSMLWLSEDDVRAALTAGYRMPNPGDQWSCRVRHTTSTFDAVFGLD